VICEAVLIGNIFPIPPLNADWLITSTLGSEVGSVAAGGRYDNLVGMFDPKGRPIPCVGFSVGVERVFSILEEHAKKCPSTIRPNCVDVYVCSIGKGMLKERIRLCNKLWRNKIKAEFSYKDAPKLLQQFAYCEKNQIPLAVVIGEEEMKQEVVKIKRTQDREDKGRIVVRSELINEIRSMLAQPK
jgi:histidyl-tRNA synthetase